MEKKEEKTKELQKDVAGRIRKFISDGKAKKGKGVLLFDPKLPNDWRLDLVYGEKQTYVSFENIHWKRGVEVANYVANDNEFEIEQAANSVAQVSINFDDLDSIMALEQIVLETLPFPAKKTNKRTIFFNTLK